MCDPVTATLVAVAVVSSATQSISAVKAANAQQKAINNQLAVNQKEARDQATTELFQQMRDTRREQARIRAAAGEAGLSTTSGNIDALLNDSAMQGELKTDVSMANLESRQQANEAEATSMMSRVQKPTALGVGLNMAISGASAWAGAPNAAKISKGG
jgi:hypothetical protein